MSDVPDPPAVDAPLVLVVEDSAFDRHLVGELLVRQGWRAAFAEDVPAALEHLQRQQPALVLTDLHLPGPSGLDLLEEVRGSYAELPVVLMTAFGSELIAMEALRSGAASYVPKSHLASDLASTLEQVHTASQATRQQQRLQQCLVEVEQRYRLDNDPALIGSLVRQVQEQMGGLKLFPPNQTMRVGIALEEALLNGLYHGNLEVSSDLRQADGEEAFRQLAEQRRQQSPFRERRLEVVASLRQDHARFEIRDEGPGFDVNSLPDPTDPSNLERVGGRGVLLMRTFMDEVCFNDRGNQVTLLKRTPKPAAEK